MKKLFLAILFFAGSSLTYSQVEKLEDRQEQDQDKMQQLPDRPAQLDLERRILKDAQRNETEKKAKIRAERSAKTKVNQKPTPPLNSHRSLLK